MFAQKLCVNTCVDAGEDQQGNLQREGERAKAAWKDGHVSFLCFLSLLTLLISVRVLLLVCAGIIRKRQIMRYIPVVILLSFEIF